MLAGEADDVMTRTRESRAGLSSTRRLPGPLRARHLDRVHQERGREQLRDLGERRSIPGAPGAFRASRDGPEPSRSARRPSPSPRRSLRSRERRRTSGAADGEAKARRMTIRRRLRSAVAFLSGAAGLFSASASSSAILFWRLRFLVVAVFAFFSLALENTVEKEKRGPALGRLGASRGGAPELGLLEDRLGEVGVGQVGAGQVGAGEVRSDGPGESQVRVLEVGPLEVGADQKRARQIRLETVQPEKSARFKLACRKLPNERSAREKLTPSACASARSALANVAPDEGVRLQVRAPEDRLREVGALEVRLLELGGRAGRPPSASRPRS